MEKIIIAGAGGQGIMLLGKVIARAALRSNLNVTWFPAYGAEVRGGTAHCMVIIAREEIASPYIDKADTLIIMNEPSLMKFRQRIKSKGLLLINNSLVSLDIIKNKTLHNNRICLPFTELAAQLGDIRVANMVALGAYITQKETFSKQIIFSAIEEIAPEGKRQLIEINKQAVEEGMRVAR
jgi:2-oxoglutarate ferredoxin oxidoreductase subunit gamma